ncbi:MAG: hypothetical protein HFI88_01215 [Lachnospiraceae bacterium]|nr:hypothetical protein [Lachnospiraceae bacterium]
MTQQNTTEKASGQTGYNRAGQENRPRKKRRRRNPAAGGSAADIVSLQAETDGGGQTGADRQEPGPALNVEHPRRTLPETPDGTDAASQAETAQKASAAPETAPDTAQKVSATQDTAPETAVAESIDYQAAYQEIYRDILENLRSFSPSDQVACCITEEHISEYLNNSHAEKVMQFKERREKRFFAALELIAVLAAIVLVIHYLQNNSAILVNILYIIAGLGALFLWKFQPRSDDKPDSGPDKEAR